VDLSDRPRDPDRPPPEDRGRGRSAERELSSTVPLEQIEQSAVKRLWRQKSDDTACHYAGVPTAVLSDLHVGAVNKRSLAPEPRALAALAERLAGVDHVVLLGDVLEMREAPLAPVLAAAEPVFRTIADAVGDGRVTLVAGNHDHQLAAPVLDARRIDGAGPMALDAEVAAPSHGPVGRMAEWLGAAELRVAYPGVWLREDVFATHGHYLDIHNTVPALECLAVSATERALGRSADDRRSPEDYEAAIAPAYSFMFELAQTRRAERGRGDSASLAVWRRTGGSDGPPSLSGQLLARVVVPAFVAALNRAGIGPYSPELNPYELRRAALRAMHSVVERLGIDAPHVIFGHTHRSGPWPDDDASEWARPGGGSLVNSGCWIIDEAFGSTGPYSPGTCVFLDDEGPPRLERLL
jgi:predicted phosphodiesterase